MSEPGPTTTTPQVPTYNMTLSDEGHTAPFQCLIENPQPPDLLKTQELAKIIVEQYTNKQQGLKKWRQMRPFVIEWTENVKKQGPQARQSVPLNFDALVNHLIAHRGIDYQRLGLGRPEQSQANWMDTDITTWGHYAPTSNNGTPNTLTMQLQMALGPEFPVSPAIDREGFATTSLQLHLQRGLLRSRERLLQEASSFVPQSFDRAKGEHAQLIVGGNPPLAALMEFFNLCVSIVDITLMQAYYAGFYASASTGLTFRESVMGAATGRRVSDKVKWVRALSGNDLNAFSEIKVFNELKAVRNHLAHFDPPCFSATIDDVASWLSKVPDLAWLLIKIRRCLKVPISGPIIKMALCPLVTFIPRDPKHVRHPQRNDAGYLSSTWQGEHPHRGRDQLRIPDAMVDKLEKIRSRIQKLGKRDISLAHVVSIILTQRLSQLEGMDNEGLMKQLESELR